MATSYELNVIAAAVIGGANLAGGIGGPLGAIVGCVLLEVIRNGLVLAQVNSYWQQALVGVIIILAVLVDRIRSRMSCESDGLTGKATNEVSSIRLPDRRFFRIGIKAWRRNMNL